MLNSVNMDPLHKAVISMISSNFFHIIHEGVAAYARSPQGEHIAAQGETSPTQKLIFRIKQSNYRHIMICCLMPDAVS